MKITPQDIIDKKFGSKFRGLDPAEVGAFLKELAEMLARLAEENNRLSEKVSALQKQAKSAGSAAPREQVELPPGLDSTLDELKKGSSAINEELTALKEDRTTYIRLGKGIKGALGALQKTLSESPVKEGKAKIPQDLASTLEDLKKGLETANTELAALKDAAGKTPQASGEGGDLAGTLDDLKKGLKKDLQVMLKTHFAELSKKISAAGPVAAAPKPKGDGDEELAAAIIADEPEGAPEEEPDLPDFDDDEDDDELEILQEDDLLDVDRLRGVFTSVLDGVSDGESSRSAMDDAGGGLLFIEDLTLDLEDDLETENEKAGQA